MTEVTFHFNAPDRFEYASRLLRKALRLGSQVAVTAPTGTLSALDRVLWTFDPIEFVPHLLVKGAGAVPERLKGTPIWLIEAAEAAPHREVLLNLGDTPPPGFESFLKLIEVVSGDDGERRAARARWKHYQSRGYAVRGHEVAPS